MSEITSPVVLDSTYKAGVAKQNYLLGLIAAGLGKSAKRYGIRINQADSNPDTRVEYLYDAIGMQPAKMNFTSGAFEYGDWKDVWFVRDNKPCMVKFDGTEDYALNPNDYSKKLDGSASDVSNADYLGNAMAKIPLIWVKRYTEGGYEYKIFCEIQYDDTYKAYPFTRPDGSIADAMYYPMFKGSMDGSGRLRSIAGVKPQSNTTASAEKTAAANCGSKWGLVTWQAWDLIMDLQELISKSTNRQAKFGQGHSEGGSSASSFLTCGSLSTAGQFFGYSSTGSAVKTFHIENPYAERWERLEGMLFVDGTWKVKDTPGTDGYNFSGTGFEALSTGHPSDNGYVVTSNSNEHGSFPASVGGSDATYWCDYYYQNTSGTRVPLVGGACNYGAACGRYVYVNSDAGDADWTLGASPFLQNPS